ncbi:von Willebrand factor D and EGF domain-containing protein-like [Saccostrea echinata]|uniref:von Willebrand factor D and EGF domain-containing protein-like n=1 Tax=Saccostrea echinata TaxID=191078 RepID=UPI002A829ABB|nr:von Willebrand factor D and EGF domain-containing protein-like [Saccostrea echinata]
MDLTEISQVGGRMNSPIMTWRCYASPSSSRLVGNLSTPSLRTDPCSSYTLLRDQYKRSRGNTLQPGDISISDNFLSAGWYRFESGAGNDMVTSAPSITQCGTVFPIWMQGSLPSDADGEVERTACIVGFMNTCEKTLTIMVKNCRDYRVYHLVPSPQASTGYCIGEEYLCPAGQTSLTFFTPCQTYTPVNTKPRVNVSLEYITRKVDTGPIAAVFKCLFAEPPGDPYWYDTHWYINNEEVKVVESRPYQDNQSWLYPKDWVHKHNMNMMVKCSLRVRRANGGIPGHYNYSEEFRAGMFPSSYAYEVKEGDTINIELMVTVPVGCFNTTFRTGCDVEVYLQTPNIQTNVGSCQDYTGQGPIAFKEKGCGITIKSSTWRQKQTFKVTGKTDGLVNLKDREVNLRLGTKTESRTDVSGVWLNFTMPNIKINVQDTDKTVANKSCHANTDPRMKTFDGKIWTAQIPGEFIMYRDISRDIAVHALFSSCEWNNWEGEGPCGCGIAVKVEDSLFAYRTCEEISYNFTKPLKHHDTIYHVCSKEHMVIEMNRTWTTITLTTGATVEYKVGKDWLYNIHITPSIFDKDNVDGLCGNLNGKDFDDFMLPGSSTTTSDKNIFQRSWSVNNTDESLFGHNIVLKNKAFEVQRYCDCSTTKSGLNDQEPLNSHNTANCSPTSSALLCMKTTSRNFTSTCETYEYRDKRDVNGINFKHHILRRNADPDDIMEVPPLTFDPKFDPNYIPPIPTWRNGWTEESAREVCEEAILNDPAEKECRKYIQMDKNSNIAIEECILDIRDAGTKEFLSHTIESLKESCFGEVKRYEEFYKTNSKQKLSVVEKIGKLACPSNCSANGVCNKGVCTCDDMFVGDDCSHKKTSPPVNTTLPENGLCKTSKRPCAKTNIFGHFMSETVYVKFKYFLITDIGRLISLSTHTTKATYIGPTIIKAMFPTGLRSKTSHSRTVYGSGFDISLSYDEVNYGESMSLVIYNDDCFSCNARELECNKTRPCPETTTQGEVTKFKISIQNEYGEILRGNVVSWSRRCCSMPKLC